MVTRGIKNGMAPLACGGAMENGTGQGHLSWLIKLVHCYLWYNIKEAFEE